MKEKQIDYLHTDNKYVDSSKIKFNKEYIMRIWLNRLLSIFVFFAIIGGGIFAYLFIFNNTITIDDVKYNYDSNKEFKISQHIVYEKVGLSDTPIDEYLKFVYAPNSSYGELVALPYGIVEVEEDKQIVLKQNQYAVKCKKGLCDNSKKIEIIEKKTILGVVNEE